MRLLVVAIVLAGCTTPTTPPADVSPDPGLMAHLEAVAAFPELRLETDHGTIRLVLYTDWLPQTTQHIIELAKSGVYDGTLLHRVVDDFVIQGGDPTGTGEGGSGPAGTPDPVPLEIHPGLDFGSGAVGLARWTDDTGDSQYFITEKPALHLSRPNGTAGQVFGAYALFGQVFEGLPVVRSIATVETVPHLDRPVEDVVVRTAQVLPPPAIDLGGLVLRVVPDIEAWGDVGVLETPRHILAGHPATLRFTVQDGCALAGPAPLVDGPAVVEAAWRDVDHDACTREATVVFPAPGAYRMAGADLEVLAWHDAYGPFVPAPGSSLRL